MISLEFLPNRNYFAGNCETGQLTNKGFEQEYMTGVMYRERYVVNGFLPPNYDSSLIYLRSDEADRLILFIIITFIT